MANQFLEGRVIAVDLPYTNQAAATTIGGGIFIPAGALVTGLTLMQTGAASTIASIGPVTVYAGATSLGSLAGSAMPAQTVATRPALASTAGVVVSAAAQLLISVGTWLTSNAAPGGFTPTVYVGYIKY
jgi:hypothetical protein